MIPQHQSFPLHKQSKQVAWSPSGKTLALIESKGELLLISVASGERTVIPFPEGDWRPWNCKSLCFVGEAFLAVTLQNYHDYESVDCSWSPKTHDKQSTEDSENPFREMLLLFNCTQGVLQSQASGSGSLLSTYIQEKPVLVQLHQASLVVRSIPDLDVLCCHSLVEPLSSRSPHAFSVCRDRAFIASEQGIHIVSLVDGECLSTWKAESDTQFAPTRLAISKDGEKVVVQDAERRLQLWERGKLVQMEHFHFLQNEHTLALSPDETLLVAGGVLLSFPDFQIVRWLLHATSLHTDGRNVLFSPCGKRLLLQSGQYIHLLDLERILGEEMLLGPMNPVSHLVLSPDGRFLALGTESGRIFIYDLEEDDLLHVLRPHRYSLSALCFDKSGKRLFVSFSSVLLEAWDVRLGLRLQSWPSDEFSAQQVTLSADGSMLIANCYQEVLFLDAETGEERYRFGPFEKENAPEYDKYFSISAVSLHPDGEQLAIALENGVVPGMVVDIQTGETCYELSNASFVLFSPDGTSLLTSAYPEALWRSWPPDETSKVSWSRRGKKFYQAAFLADGGSYIWASGSEAGQIFRKSADKEREWHMRYHDGIRTMDVDTAGERLYTNGFSFWTGCRSFHEGALQQVLPAGSGSSITMLRFSQDGDSLAVSDYNGRLQIWQTSEHTRVEFLDTTGLKTTGETSVSLGEVKHLCWEEDGSLVACGHKMYRWKASPEVTFAEATEEVAELNSSVKASSNCGRWMFVDNPLEEKMQVFEVMGEPTPRLHGSIARTSSFFESAILSNDGNTLVVAQGPRYGGGIAAWSVQTGRRLATLQTSHPMKSLSFHPDGYAILWVEPLSNHTTQHPDAPYGVLVKWDVQQNRISEWLSPAQLPGLTKAEHWIWSKDGRYAVVIGGQILPTVVDVHEGQILHVLDGHIHGMPQVAAFSPDNQLIATGDTKGEIRLWSLKEGRCFAVYCTTFDGSWFSQTQAQKQVVDGPYRQKFTKPFT